MRRLTTAMAMCLLLAACDAGSLEPSTGNRAHDLLLRKGEVDRAVAFHAVLGNEPCDRVTRTFFQGINKPDRGAFWNVACNDGHRYSILISANATGSTKVLDCTTVTVLKLTPCFQKFE